MRVFVVPLLLVCLVAGCKRHTRPTMPPIPLRNIVLHDVHVRDGGFAIWALDDGSAIVQIVEPATDEISTLRENRYQIRLIRHEWNEIEALIGAHEFICILTKEREGGPDEAHPIIQLRTRDDVRARVRKWANDPHPDFDPVYAYLRTLCRRMTDDQLIHSGDYDWDWRPEGFDPLW